MSFRACKIFVRLKLWSNFLVKIHSQSVTLQDEIDTRIACIDFCRVLIRNWLSYWLYLCQLAIAGTNTLRLCMQTEIGLCAKATSNRWSIFARLNEMIGHSLFIDTWEVPPLFSSDWTLNLPECLHPNNSKCIYVLQAFLVMSSKIIFRDRRWRLIQHFP